MRSSEPNSTDPAGASSAGLLALFGGPAGAGKLTRSRAVHVELDSLRELIVAGRADPQHPSELHGDQYRLSVRACVAPVRTFLRASYDVAIDDAIEPDVFEHVWRPLLGGMC